ncbi:MAG: hypothetical protein PGMFKBFP_03334 [Anaerolineales bacterium]|nr:hypothetical protein [Anaerolineales bacterium]
MVGTAEAHQSQSSFVVEIAQAERAIADRARAQQRRGFGIGQGIGDRVDEVGAEFHILGVSAVHVAARGLELRTEILPPRLAEVALAARGRDPRRADALTALRDAHRLMSQNDGQPRRGRPPFDLVQFGAADSAADDAQQYFVRARLGVRDGFEREGSGILRQRSESAQEHGFHDSIVQQKIGFKNPRLTLKISR